MIRQRDFRQAPLIDPWADLGPKRRRILERPWASLFRQEILPELPVLHLAQHFRADFGRPAQDLHAVLRVRGLTAVRFCVTLKAVGVNLFRAAAVRRARNPAVNPAPGSPSRFSRLFSRFKKQISRFGATIGDFLIPDANSVQMS